MVGINARNKSILDQGFICPICSFILQDPVQLTVCGHRQCQSCFDAQNGSTIICSQCCTEISRHQIMIDRGFKRDMQSLPIDCSLCDWNGTFQNYQKHLDKFHPNLKCEYCDEQFESTNTPNQHEVLQREKVTIDCLLKDFGCSEQIIRSKMAEHYLTKQHQETILKVLQQMKSQLLDTKMDTDLPRTTTTTTTTAGVTDPATHQFQEFHGMLSILSDETLSQDFSQVKLALEEINRALGELKSNQDVLKQDLASLKEKIEDLQYVSYDGSFIWKITNVREKLVDAESERPTSIYSPPFYSSPTGYKMRARLYLHGDGNARRTHMSLFFVLMRGLNDAILKFPFNYTVTFCLYDQTSQQRHIIDSFRPDIRSNSFQRRRSDMNIASGIPKFFPLAMIQQEGNPYVQDNTMFIKVLVDFGDLHKTVLSYALSLNPGIPTHIQQAMIKEEAERRAQQQLEQEAESKEIQLSCDESNR